MIKIKTPFTHNCGAQPRPSHGQIAGPMLGSAPHFCAFTHENSAAAEPCYFVQCDSFRSAWRSTCFHTQIDFALRNNDYAHSFLTIETVIIHTKWTARPQTTSEAGPKAASHLAAHFEFCAFTHKPGHRLRLHTKWHGSATAGPLKLGQKRPRIWPRILSFVPLHTNRATARPRLAH